MDKYLTPLISKFKNNTDKETALQQKKYLLNKFDFLGIKAPLRKELLNSHIKEYGKSDINMLEQHVKYLWNLNEREFQYLAVNICEKHSKNISPFHINIIEFMIENKSWWDSVDSVVRLNKIFFQKFPDLIPEHTQRWINSENFWFQRSALLFQLNFRENINKDLMFEYILKVKDSDEFFVLKAIGWILRQYSKFQAQEVIRFVNNTDLAPLSKREALKLIHKKTV